MGYSGLTPILCNHLLNMRMALACQELFDPL